MVPLAIDAQGSERFYGLDLLRTMAILLVITWHIPRSQVPFHWKPATWAGVDLFFVLSGYLICSQLLRPYTSGAQPSFTNFYLRRALRVLPAYFFVLLLYFALPQFREQPAISPAWKFLTFTQNFGLDFFSRGAFSHAWSLCVEEHFYLGLPVIVYWLMKRPSFRWACTLAAAIVISGLIVRGVLWMYYIKPLTTVHDGQLMIVYLEKIYYPTYSRLDALLVGVVIAAVKSFRPIWWKQLTARGNTLLAGAIAILGCAFYICQDEMASFAAAVIGFPLFALGFGLLVMSSLSSGSLLAKYRVWGMSAGATLAYSVYLTHKEIMYLDQQYLGRFVSESSPWWLAIYGLSILAAGCILYLLVERPFLKLRDRMVNRTAVTQPAPSFASTQAAQ